MAHYAVTPGTLPDPMPVARSTVLRASIARKPVPRGARVTIQFAMDECLADVTPRPVVVVEAASPRARLILCEALHREILRRGLTAYMMPREDVLVFSPRDGGVLIVTVRASRRELRYDETKDPDVPDRPNNGRPAKTYEWGMHPSGGSIELRRTRANRGEVPPGSWARVCSMATVQRISVAKKPVGGKL